MGQSASKQLEMKGSAQDERNVDLSVYIPSTKQVTKCTIHEEWSTE